MIQISGGRNTQSKFNFAPAAQNKDDEEKESKHVMCDAIIHVENHRQTRIGESFFLGAVEKRNKRTTCREP